MTTNDLPRFPMQAAAIRSVRMARMMLKGSSLDPCDRPASLLVTPSMPTLPVPGNNLDRYIDEVVKQVYRSEWACFNEGDPTQSIHGIELIPGRLATRREMVALQIATLTRANVYGADLRHLISFCEVGRGDVRGFGGRTYRFVDLMRQIHTMHVACAGWDDDANSVAVDLFPAALKLELVHTVRQSEPAPAIVSPTFVLDYPPSDGWQLKQG